MSDIRNRCSQQQHNHIRRHPHPLPAAQPFNTVNMRTMEREEGHRIGNGVDRVCFHTIDVDRGRDVIVCVDREYDLSASSANRTSWPRNAMPGWNTSSTIQQLWCSSGTQTDNHNRKMGHDLGGSANNKTMPDAGDNTINNKYCCCRNQHT